jgi:hypothetical protein
VRASEPPDLGTVTVSCAVRQAVAIQVSLTNPTDKPLSLRAHYSCPSLVGPASFVAPPQEPAVFECYYAPLLLRKEEGVVRLISQEVSLQVDSVVGEGDRGITGGRKRWDSLEERVVELCSAVCCQQLCGLLRVIGCCAVHVLVHSLTHRMLHTEKVQSFQPP